MGRIRGEGADICQHVRMKQRRHAVSNNDEFKVDPPLLSYEPLRSAKAAHESEREQQQEARGG
jgi:hypothetical protein